MKKLVIGILAHVDSGKTTLTEALLYKFGEIRKIGRVDHGDAFLDNHEIERDRGITIFSKQAIIQNGDMELTILDTPGHVDFSSEAERVLGVLDYAILVVSGSEGVQSHTQTLWRLLMQYGVPVFIFVNKMDISDLGKEKVMRDIRTSLSDRCVCFDGKEAVSEELALCDDTLADSLLEKGSIEDKDIIRAVTDRKVFPCYFGSALKIEGIDEFAAGFDKYTEAPKYGDEFAAKVYKISEDDEGNRLTHLKVTGGTLNIKEIIDGEKVNNIRIYSGKKFKPVPKAERGTVCAVTGLTKTYPGQGLGAEEMSDAAILEPVLTYCVILPENIDTHTALVKLKKLEEEDPQLQIAYSERLGEIYVRVMGEVQLEVLKRIIAERFDMNIEFGHGSIAYKETVAETAEGMGHYEPLRHYAEVRLLIEPAPRGSGIQLDTSCSEDILERNWQRLILTHLQEKTHIGVLTGSPLTDVKITLTAGRAHNKHTEGGDFRQATYRAVRQGLKSTKCILLEPWYSFRLEVPSENVGRAMTDIERMCGRMSQPEISGDMSVICGNAPVSELRDYHTEVISYTRGRGMLSCSISGYEECHNQDEIVEQTGYDSEADINNPADSVFCAHGAGFTVKWDKVGGYMHTESVIKKRRMEKTGMQVKKYIERVADDDELIKIFERTYGPIKRRPPEALKTKKEVSAKPPKVKVKTLDKEYLLVDGYNIIFAWEELKKLAAENLDAAREGLINILCNYCGVRGCELIVVFDAYKVKGNPGSVEKVHNISVVYTKEAETADMYIEKVTHELGRKHNNIRVATSDGLEQLIILGNGAYRVSASAFYEEVKQIEESIKEYINN